MLAYLLDRFKTDADTLRARAAALRLAPAQPGPDASVSMAMAHACDTVTAMLQAVPATSDAPTLLASLQALIPLFEKHAQAETAPPVRAVYVGAATRVREVTSVEAKHLRDADATVDVDEDLVDGIDEDDADVDNDDLHDDGGSDAPWLPDEPR